MYGDRILRDLGPGVTGASRQLLIWLRQGMFPHARPVPGPAQPGGCKRCGHLDNGDAKVGHGCVYGCCLPQCEF